MTTTHIELYSSFSTWINFLAHIRYVDDQVMMADVICRFHPISSVLDGPEGGSFVCAASQHWAVLWVPSAKSLVTQDQINNNTGTTFILVTSHHTMWTLTSHWPPCPCAVPQSGSASPPWCPPGDLSVSASRRNQLNWVSNFNIHWQLGNIQRWQAKF